MKEKRAQISISTEFITLGQFLKLADIIRSGGEAKFYLQEHKVVINGEVDQRRGRKLYPGDVVEAKKVTYEIISV